MGRKVTNEIIDEPGKPMAAQSKMGEAKVTELEIKGIENLTPMEKKHLLLQLARDKVEDPSAGPWEIIDIFRNDWRSVKTTLAQPVEIEVKDQGRDSLFRVSMDITKLERELEMVSKGPEKNFEEKK
ncbi:MAG: hypothetical protein ACPK85_16750 [Methanosarcina sp.]